MAQNNRDDFPEKIIKILQERVGNRCSRCRCLTSGPNTAPEKATRIGVAAHITAAAKSGPRYDESLTVEERKSIQNGIWLCQNCARLIDVDVRKYPVELINQWKLQAEESASRELEGREAASSDDEVGYCCPYCDTFVKLGKFVCVGCQAEIVYGSTKQEWQKNLKIGRQACFVLVALFFVFLPDLLSKWLSINVPVFFGMNFYVALVFAIGVSFCIGYFNAKIFDQRRKNHPPRFFRNMNT